MCRFVPQIKIFNCGRILRFRRPDASYDGLGQVVPATVKKNKTDGPCGDAGLVINRRGDSEIAAP